MQGGAEGITVGILEGFSFFVNNYLVWFGNCVSLLKHIIFVCLFNFLINCKNAPIKVYERNRSVLGSLDLMMMFYGNVGKISYQTDNVHDYCSYDPIIAKISCKNSDTTKMPALKPRH